MRRTGGRLSVAESFGRSGHLESIATADTNSASLAKAEREIKRLKLENQKLKTDLNDTRSLYNQLIQENSHEKFDERRVTLLKSQVIQLERQVLLLNEALCSRGEVLLDIENSLVWLADKCRSYITMDVRGPLVNVERSDLTLIVETVESARIKLYKQLENKTTEKLSRPLKFYSEFVHPTRGDNLTLLDVSSGSLEHLNLKHVTKLETKLSELYRELIHLHQIIDENTNTESSSPWTSGHVISAARERLMTQMLKTCAMTKDCSSDLLDLSMLFPSAPWPPLKKPALKEVTAERVLSCLPSFPRSQAAEGQTLIQALVTAYNYKVYMLNSKIQALHEDVKYHQKVYNLQLKYTESLFQAIREAYTAFEESSNEVIVKPLKDILEAYVDLNQTASEVALKRFLSAFKHNAPQLSDIIETIGVKAFEESEGSKVLSQFGEEFFESLERVVKDQQTKRDREANKLEDIRAEQRKLDGELRDLLEEQENRTQERLSRFELSNDVLEPDHHDSSRLTDRQESPAPVVRDDLNVKVKKKITPDSSKAKGLHMKEWVGVFESSDLFNNDDTSEEMNDKELLEHEKLMNKFETQAVHAINVKDTSSSDLAEDWNHADKPPLKAKTKKKLNYVPNTFVPNRTLQLRRSGSLTKLSSDLTENKFDGNGALPDKESRSESEVRQKGSAGLRSSRSQSRERPAQSLPQKSRPAFR